MTDLREKLDVNPECGHHQCFNRPRCWWRLAARNSPTNPDPTGRCRVCAIGTMDVRSIVNGGTWATCSQCGTSRFVEGQE